MATVRPEDLLTHAKYTAFVKAELKERIITLSTALFKPESDPAKTFSVLVVPYSADHEHGTVNDAAPAESKKENKLFMALLIEYTVIWGKWERLRVSVKAKTEEEALHSLVRKLERDLNRVLESETDAGTGGDVEPLQNENENADEGGGDDQARDDQAKEEEDGDKRKGNKRKRKENGKGERPENMEANQANQSQAVKTRAGRVVKKTKKAGA